MARSSFYKILRSFQQKDKIEINVGSGQKAEKLRTQKKKLVKTATDKICVPQASRTSKEILNSQIYVRKTKDVAKVDKNCNETLLMCKSFD